MKELKQRLHLINLSSTLETENWCILCFSGIERMVATIVLIFIPSPRILVWLDGSFLVLFIGGSLEDKSIPLFSPMRFASSELLSIVFEVGVGRMLLRMMAFSGLFIL